MADQPTDAVPDARIARFHERLTLGVGTFSRGDVEWLLDRLAAVELERDEWKRLQQQSSAQIVRLGEQVSEALDQADALKEATAALLALRAAIDLLFRSYEDCPAGTLSSDSVFAEKLAALLKKSAAGVADQDGPAMSRKRT